MRAVNKLLSFFTLLAFLAPMPAFAAELPDFKSDHLADQWLREKSAWYRTMAESVDKNGGYTFLSNAEIPGGLAYTSEGRGFIELSAKLKSAHRVSILIFELTNLYQEHRHQEVANRVRTGELNNPEVFWLLREVIEHDGLRLHHKVLHELQTTLGTIPPEMITWISSTAKTYTDYQLPFVYDYLKAQEASDHKTHYMKLFEIHRAEYLETQKRAKEKTDK